MKKVKMLKDYGAWKKGIHIMDNSRAKFFCKKHIDWDYFERTGNFRMIAILGIELENLGLHFGRSKYNYVKHQRSKVHK